MSNRGHNLRSHIVNLPEDSKLFTVVPKEPFDIHGRYEIERTPQREELFLDERVTVYIVLQTAAISRGEVETYLPNLQITLETFCESPTQEEENNQSQPEVLNRELVDSRSVKDDEPVIEVAVSHKRATSEQSPISVTWKSEVHLNRARIKQLKSSIYFVASVSLLPSQNAKPPGYKDEYLPSGIPDSINILEAFRTDPEFQDDPPVLTAARLSKILPARAAIGETSRPLRSRSRDPITLVPAVGTRLSLSHVGVAPNLAKVLASLDVEVDPLLNANLSLESVAFIVSDGLAEPFATSSSLLLPKLCKPQDSLSFVYDLIPSNAQALSSASADQGTFHTLTLHLTARVLSEERNDRSYPIKVHWRSQVDLSTVYRSPLNRPVSQLAVPQNLPNLLTLTISGPPTVRVGSTLRWSFLLANRSQTRTLRLAIIPIITPSRLSSSAAGISDPPALIPLTPDLEVGPLPAGASATAEMRFLVLRGGVLKVHAVRIVDLDDVKEHGQVKGQGVDKLAGATHVDLTGVALPSIVAVEDEV